MKHPSNIWCHDLRSQFSPLGTQPNFWSPAHHTRVLLQDRNLQPFMSSSSSIPRARLRKALEAFSKATRGGVSRASQERGEQGGVHGTCVDATEDGVAGGLPGGVPGHVDGGAPSGVHGGVPGGVRGSCRTGWPHVWHFFISNNSGGVCGAGMHGVCGIENITLGVPMTFPQRMYFGSQPAICRYSWGASSEISIPSWSKCSTISKALKSIAAASLFPPMLLEAPAIWR